jgi:hypothetical protein
VTLGQNPRIDPREREALLRTVNAIESRAAPFGGFVRPVGNPATVGLGTGNQVFMGGVFVFSRGAPSHVLVEPASVWVWPLILLTVGTFVELVFGVQFLTSDVPPVIGWAVVALLFFIFSGAAFGAWAWASYSRRESLVLDADSRSCQELYRGKVVLTVPRSLMRRVWVQVYTAQRMGTVYDVLISLGFAELWIDQPRAEQGARALAETVARCLDLPLDPEIQRKQTS